MLCGCEGLLRGFGSVPRTGVSEKTGDSSLEREGPDNRQLQVDEMLRMMCEGHRFSWDAYDPGRVPRFACV